MSGLLSRFELIIPELDNSRKDIPDTNPGSRSYDRLSREFESRRLFDQIRDPHR